MTASKLCGPQAARPPGKRNQCSGNPVSCPSSLTALPSRRKKTLILEKETKGKGSHVEAGKGGNGSAIS